MRQTLDDPRGDHDWVLDATVDLAASDAAGTKATSAAKKAAEAADKAAASAKSKAQAASAKADEVKEGGNS